MGPGALRGGGGEGRVGEEEGVAPSIVPESSARISARNSARMNPS